MRFFSGYLHQHVPAWLLVLSAWKKPHDIVTLSFSEGFFQVEGQAKCSTCDVSTSANNRKKVGISCKQHTYFLGGCFLRPKAYCKKNEEKIFPKFFSIVYKELLPFAKVTSLLKKLLLHSFFNSVLHFSFVFLMFYPKSISTINWSLFFFNMYIWVWIISVDFNIYNLSAIL